MISIFKLCRSRKLSRQQAKLQWQRGYNVIVVCRHFLYRSNSSLVDDVEDQLTYVSLLPNELQHKQQELSCTGISIYEKGLFPALLSAPAEIALLFCYHILHMN